MVSIITLFLISVAATALMTYRGAAAKEAPRPAPSYPGVLFLTYFDANCSTAFGNPTPSKTVEPMELPCGSCIAETGTGEKKSVFRTCTDTLFTETFYSSSITCGKNKNGVEMSTENHNYTQTLPVNRCFKFQSSSGGGIGPYGMLFNCTQ